MPNDTADAVIINPPGDLVTADLCVIGAGAGGLAVAAAGAAFGQRVVLIEKHKMGGDALNYGALPSKALIAAAQRANAIRTAAHFGVSAGEPQIDARGLHRHIKSVIAAVAPNASIERFAGMGVRVITAAGKFVDASTVVAGEHRITARRFVVATGSSPSVPAVPGLADVPYFTTETIFDNTTRIAHLIVIGGSGAALELAQAYRRLGSDVTVLEAGKALAHGDPELTPFVLARLRDEGVVLREGATVQGASSSGGSVAVTIKTDEGTETITGSHLLIAQGRKPNVTDLGLDAAGIAYDKIAGIRVNAGLVTSNKRVFAIGDVTGGAPSAHAAADHAEIVLKCALFRIPTKTTARAMPSVTFTDPQLASVGLSETQARAKHGKINVLRWPYSENDCAHATRETQGHIKVVVSPKGHILGATIVGADAAELIQMWSLALSQRLKIKAMTEWISPYPTLSEFNKRAAFRYFATAPSNPVVRKAIAWLAKLG